MTAVLGPRGSFSEQAAKELAMKNIRHCQTITDALEAVKLGKEPCAVVPIENSLEGTVNETLDYLTFNKGLNIYAETVLPIKHFLLGLNKSKIKKVISHPQALAQCRNWIRKNLKVSVESRSSTAEAAREVSEKKDVSLAAIASKQAAEIYSLKVLAKNIQDNNANATRFIVVSKKQHAKAKRDKTSIVFYYRENRPGILLEVLGEFAKRKINLTKIESRPSKKVLGDYLFYIDFEGHAAEKSVKEALSSIRKKVASLKILGSYPKSF